MKWLFFGFWKEMVRGCSALLPCVPVSLSPFSSLSLLHTIADLVSQNTYEYHRQSTYDVLLYCIFHTAATVNSD
ncbi:hypothetical protein Hdeb2414_s0026g00682041 [Helianthus debilis subsp. tardiflorus]